MVRPNGAPLYTFVNPVDDALMGVTHVLRGEDLLSSTPRQIALYAALIEIGVTDFVPRFGHLPYVMGEGNKKLSKRDPESNLFHHRDRGFVPEGLLNYLSLLGWSIAADRDVFSQDELVDAFDVVDVNPNPARFDLKKAESINGDHIRLLALEDFTARIVPYLDGPGQRSADRGRAGDPAGGGAARAGARQPARRGARHARVPVHGRRRRSSTRPTRSRPTPTRRAWCSTRRRPRWSSSTTGRPRRSRRRCARR